MSEAGFEYIAVDYDTVRRGMTADKSLPGVSDEQFMAQYGYGISTLYTGLAPQISSANTPAKIGLGEQNVEIFNKLSEPTRLPIAARFLVKIPKQPLQLRLKMKISTRTGGCTRTAIEQVFTEDQLKATYFTP